MKERLLDLLACPTCGGDILLAYASRYEDREIKEAVLSCKKCTREDKVTRGIPRFAERTYRPMRCLQIAAQKGIRLCVQCRRPSSYSRPEASIYLVGGKSKEGRSYFGLGLRC